MTTTVTHSPASGIPGPVGHPLLGVAPKFRADLLGYLLETRHDHGDLVSYRIGPRGALGRVVLGVYHPDDVHRVLTGTGKVFGRGTRGFKSLSEVVGEGVLTTEGDTWLRQRRTLQPLFTPQRVAGYTDLMTLEAERILADPRFNEGTIDLHQFARRYALRVLGRTIFGHDVDHIVSELERLVPHGADLIRARTFQLIRFPLHWRTPRNKQLTQVRSEFYALVDSLIEEGEQRGHGDNLVARLRAARDPETGKSLSPQEIRDQVLIFLLAGQETTTGALAFVLHCLGRNPEIQEEVAADALAGNEALTRATVQEGMRLYPPVYLADRVTTADTELAGHQVPAGTSLFVVPWVTHRHPEFWPAPETFDPQRFIGKHDRPHYAYFPFGGGPRSCMGDRFAMLEATVLLRAFLSQLRVVSREEGLHPPLRPAITLRPGVIRATLSAR